MSRPISYRRVSAEPTRREGGYTMVMTAIMLVPLMLLAALAVDVGSWYVKAQEIQRAADAAALAGVTFMPDHFDDAQDKAKEVATKNGFTDGVNGVSVVASPVPGNNRRLTVTITDPRVRTYFGQIIRSSISISRSATAEYVMPVPLGSPRNYLGTGTLVKSTSTTSPEYLFASENGYCTSSMQGDQRASAFFFGQVTSGRSTSWPTTCTGTPNEDYTDTNYQYSIELPTTRTTAVDVIIYDGNFWPKTDSNGNANGPALDMDGGGSSSDMRTTFTLYRPDDTPLDDLDNPTAASVAGTCASSSAGVNGTKIFEPNTSDTNYTFNPSSTTFTSSSWWQLCRIPTSAPGGRYVLGVVNQGGSALEKTQGVNNFSIAATPSSPQKICDARKDTTCPKVYANSSLSVRAATSASTANFFLSEIGKQHAGKKVVITLWDPAEGGDSLRIRKPTASDSWADQTFDWSATSGESVTNATSINVGNYNFNGELVTITFTLPTTYSPPTDNDWWQIAYGFKNCSSGQICVTDRTTWSVSIIGDPVHLVG